MPRPVNTGFDLLFSDPLQQLIARAKAEGYNPFIRSGARTAQEQAKPAPESPGTGRLEKF